MTETDSTNRPLQMPVNFLPQLEKYRVYQMMKDMIRNVIIHLPKDHVKHMKIFATRVLCTSEASRVMVLVEPGLVIDMQALVKKMIQDFGCFAITRRCVLDRYEKHDDYVPGCVSPYLMSEITKELAMKEPVPSAGWLMFDHPCTFREARCLQQDGVLPTVTLVLMKAPPIATQTISNHTPPRNFFQQDFDGLKLAYKATIKEICIDPADNLEVISTKCFNGVRACNAGLQGPRQGVDAIGAPSVYRVLLLGPRGSGRSSQAINLSKQFGMVFLHYDALYKEAAVRDDDIGRRIRKYGTNNTLREQIVRSRLLRKDCIDRGWVLVGYPTNGNDFEQLEAMPTPPNRIIILNTDVETCRQRTQNEGYDWCTGDTVPFGSGPRVIRHPDHDQVRREYEWDVYFTEALAELRAAAGLTAVEIDGKEPFEKVQVKIQAAVMSAPYFDIEISCSKLRKVRAD